MVGWAEETSLNVQYAHAMAPGANILLVETPVAETEGTVGFPQIVQAENYVIDHHLADVISQSFGATEETFPSRQSLLALRTASINAKAHKVTVLAGVVAIADQAAGHRLGLLNPRLYQLGTSGMPGLPDITTGNNTVTFDQGGKTHTVQGFTAVAGYDMASGLGTVDGAMLVQELSH